MFVGWATEKKAAERYLRCFYLFGGCLLFDAVLLLYIARSHIDGRAQQTNLAALRQLNCLAEGRDRLPELIADFRRDRKAAHIVACDQIGDQPG